MLEFSLFARNGVAVNARAIIEKSSGLILGNSRNTDYISMVKFNEGIAGCRDRNFMGSAFI
jgi:hypothetical protein